jgi:hypothetical protein
MEATMLSLSSRAFRGQVSDSEIVEVMEDLNGQLDEVRAAMRYLAQNSEADPDSGRMAMLRKAEGLLYAADLAIGMARAMLVEQDEADAADAEDTQGT